MAWALKAHLHVIYYGVTFISVYIMVQGDIKFPTGPHCTLLPVSAPLLTLTDSNLRMCAILNIKSPLLSCFSYIVLKLLDKHSNNWPLINPEMLNTYYKNIITVCFRWFAISITGHQILYMIPNKHLSLFWHGTSN